ncbi:hypothetical protein KUTeg_024443 [Tegillarca granosa]|uniref:N-acetylglucosamine-6-phosphate deacetylase n=1 Tax=Tegillarca granosa TaxID=220873 RepID=A0ABQ9E2V6_TEGGR|nr:hypothetical protein KUTeg_024443 [Tegillarca granosa]
MISSFLLGDWILDIEYKSKGIMTTDEGPLYQFVNCQLLRDHQLIKDDLWVRNGKILDPEKLFFDERVTADIQINCKGNIIAPGFIDVQINGAFGIDFSSNVEDIEGGINKVAKGLLAHGVTSFCPTIITSPDDIYKQVVPKVKRRNGSKDGAGILGMHLEGPFISKEKKGAHNDKHIKNFGNGFPDVLDTYGVLDDVSIVTLAPEYPRSDEVISELVKRGIVVSMGHSTANLTQGEEAANNGASFITHLFNAMLPFHHRDPHLLGLLTSKMLPKNRYIYYGLIADGIHTHPAAIRIAHRVHPDDCGVVKAVEAATLHPAELLGITDKKGTLDFNTDADFILIDDQLNVKLTFINGQVVWSCQDNTT